MEYNKNLTNHAEVITCETIESTDDGGGSIKMYLITVNVEYVQATMYSTEPIEIGTKFDLKYEDVADIFMKDRPHYDDLFAILIEHGSFFEDAHDIELSLIHI